MKNLIKEAKRLQQLAGLLKESQDGQLKIGDTVDYQLESEPMETGEIEDIANSWDEVVSKGGEDLDDWEDWFNSAWEDAGFDSPEEYANQFKQGRWYKIVNAERGDMGIWIPEMYIDN